VRRSDLNQEKRKEKSYKEKEKTPLERKRWCAAAHLSYLHHRTGKGGGGRPSIDEIYKDRKEKSNENEMKGISKKERGRGEIRIIIKKTEGKERSDRRLQGKERLRSCGVFLSSLLPFPVCCVT
jgi:hypothetical protein